MRHRSTTVEQYLITNQFRWIVSRILFFNSRDNVNRETKVRLICELMIDSSWSRAEFLNILKSCCKPEFSEFERTCDLLLIHFSSPPSRSDLENFLMEKPDRLIKFLSVKQLCRFADENRLRLSRMRAGISVSSQWSLPGLHSLAQLAEFLEISTRSLDWLSARFRNHYRVSAISKRSSGIRILEAPKYKLKCVQRKILKNLLNLIPTHPQTHGFVKQRSALSYVQEHIGKEFVLRMDLQDFFPSIDASRVFGLFRSLGYPFEVVQCLTRLCTWTTGPSILLEVASTSRSEQQRLLSLYHRDHLPQGAPTSPALANLIAYRFDCRLNGLAGSANGIYSRYADDLLFSGGSDLARGARSFESQVGAIAIEEGFRIQFRKTRKMRKSVRQAAAGIVINETTNPRRKDFDQLKAILHNCTQKSPDSQNLHQHQNFREHLLGRIHWVNQLNPNRGKKLLSIFEQIHWD